jgi:hypothetical protein
MESGGQEIRVHHVDRHSSFRVAWFHHLGHAIRARGAVSPSPSRNSIQIHTEIERLVLVIGVFTHELLDMATVENDEDNDSTKNGDTI